MSIDLIAEWNALVGSLRITRLIAMSCVALSLWIAGPSHAAKPTEVDVELILAVDVSRSMTRRELEIQRRGYAEALSSNAVAKVVANGPSGRIALTYFEWGGTHWQRTIVDWTLIESQQDLKNLAAKLTIEVTQEWRRTSISGAIDHAMGKLQDNGYTSLRQIIDVSGDGPNNDGRPVLAARKAALAKGVIINGLPLMTREGIGLQFHLEDLDEYYKHCVIGGPGSFIIPVRHWEEFPEAVRRKLVLELAQRERLPSHRVAFKWRTANGYDCLVGEKIWQIFRERFPLP